MKRFQTSLVDRKTTYRSVSASPFSTMFIFLRNRFFHSLTPNLLILQSKSLTAPFSTIQLSSESNPNSTSSERVKALFRSHGFTETQISKIIRERPQILSADPDKILAPKLDFLLSIGITNTHLPKLVCNSSNTLWRSLDKQLIPCYNSLKTVLVTNENVVKMLRRQIRTLSFNFDKCIAPNINLLTEIGVPKSRISQMLLQYPNAFCINHANFKGAVEAAIGKGFMPVDTMFTNALRVLCVLSKTTWDRKVMIYKSWGLSDDEVGIAFQSYPISMTLSEGKITKAMDIFVNEMGRNAADVVRSSFVLGYNIENRIKPRCRVIRLLISKGFLKKTISLGSFLYAGEMQFLEKFVSKYEDKVPELLSIYQERESI